MTRTDVSALALAAMLAAGGASMALAQATTDEGEADQAQTDQSQAEQGQGDEGQAEGAQAEGGGGSEQPADQPPEDQAEGADAPAADAQAGGGADAATTEQGADVTVIQEGEGAEDPAAEADVVVEEEPAEDTVITTDPAAEETAPAEGEVVVVEEAEPAVEGEVVEGDAVAVEEAEVVEPAEPVEGQIFEQSADQVLGSTLLDATAVSPEGETIGDVTDMVVSNDGQITGVVLGVGGFLGIGERKVAVSFDQIEIREGEAGDITFVLSATREQLEAAPEFQTRADIEAATPPAEGAAVETDPNAVAVEPVERGGDRHRAGGLTGRWQSRDGAVRPVAASRAARPLVAGRDEGYPIGFIPWRASASRTSASSSIRRRCSASVGVSDSATGV